MPLTKCAGKDHRPDSLPRAGRALCNLPIQVSNFIQGTLRPQGLRNIPRVSVEISLCTYYGAGLQTAALCLDTRQSIWLCRVEKRTYVCLCAKPCMFSARVKLLVMNAMTSLPPSQGWDPCRGGT